MEPGERLDELSELEGRFAFHRRMDAEAEARDIALEHDRGESFRDVLMALAPGLVVGVVTVDGAEIWGRVEAVGTDKLRLAESAREAGARARVEARRLHDIRLEAVVRLVREVEEWRR